MDSLDEKLLRLLGQDARQSSDALASKLKVSAATVRRRVRVLLRKDVLRIVGVVDPDKVGLSLAAVIALDVVHEKVEAVVQELASRPEIRWISTTTGRFDIVAVTRFRSTDELARFMQKEMAKLEGLRDSETFVCLHVEKGRYVPLDPSLLFSSDT